jgi:hypothetical protein
VWRTSPFTSADHAHTLSIPPAPAVLQRLAARGVLLESRPGGRNRRLWTVWRTSPFTSADHAHTLSIPPAPAVLQRLAARGVLLESRPGGRNRRLWTECGGRPLSRPLITRIPCRFRRPRRYSNGWLRVAFCWSPARVGGIDGFGQCGRTSRFTSADHAHTLSIPPAPAVLQRAGCAWRFVGVPPGWAESTALDRVWRTSRFTSADHAHTLSIPPAPAVLQRAGCAWRFVGVPPGWAESTALDRV